LVRGQEDDSTIYLLTGGVVERPPPPHRFANSPERFGTVFILAPAKCVNPPGLAGRVRVPGVLLPPVLSFSFLLLCFLSSSVVSFSGALVAGQDSLVYRENLHSTGMVLLLGSTPDVEHVEHVQHCKSGIYLVGKYWMVNRVWSGYILDTRFSCLQSWWGFLAEPNRW
jgi:hypothetical protein